MKKPGTLAVIAALILSSQGMLRADGATPNEKRVQRVENRHERQEKRQDRRKDRRQDRQERRMERREKK